MPARALPNLGLQAFFDLGEDGWDDEMNLNILKMSVLTQGGVAEKLAAEPGAPDEGDVVVLDETHATQANAIAVYDDGAWVYFAPSEGWLIYDRSTDAYLTFDGAVWAVLETGGGGGGGGLADAPEDGKQYGREDGAWTEIVGGGGGGGGTTFIPATLGFTQPSSPGSSTPAVNNLVARLVQAEWDMQITALGFHAANATAGALYKPFIYESNGAGASGASYPLLSAGPEKTGTVVGYNEAPLDSTVTIEKGKWYYIGVSVTGAAIAGFYGSSGFATFQPNGGSNTPPAVSPAAFQGNRFTSPASNVYSIYGLGRRSNEASTGNGASPIVFNVYDHAVPVNTGGGNAATGAWTTRPLNTTRRSEIAGSSLAANQFVLPAGTYSVTAFQQFYRVTYVQTRLRNITDGTTAVLGLAGYFTETGDCGITPLSGVFTITEAKTFELQYKCSNNFNTNGLGLADPADPAVFANLTIRQIANAAGYGVVVSDATAAYDVLAADVTKYRTMTNAAAKTVTFRPEATEALPTNGEWHFRNKGAADLTLVAGAGVTLNAPYGGSLVVPQRGTVTVKRIAVNEFDVIGVTLP